MKLGNNLDVALYQLIRARLENLAADPTFVSGERGRLWLDPSGRLRLNNGSSGVTVRDSAVQIVNGDIASAAAIDLGKLATDPLARANHTGTQTSSTISDFGSAANAALATALASNTTTDRARANHTGTQAASTISDLAAVVKAYRLSEFVAPNAAVSLGNQRITSLAVPTASTDAATKGYVDGIAQGLDPKKGVVAATPSALPTNTITANTITASVNAVLPSIDGIPLAVGDRLLVKNEVVAANNGIYTVTSLGSASARWVLTRSDDFDTWAKVPSAFVFVQRGTTQGDTGWTCASDQGGTLGTSAITWVQFSSAGVVVAGTGLTKTGNTLSIANAGVGTAQIQDLSVSGAKLQFEAVTPERLASDVIVDMAVSGETYGLGFGDSTAPTTNLRVVLDEVTLTAAEASLADSRGNFVRPLKVAPGGIGPNELASNAVNLTTTKVTGTLPIAKGGTGATTAVAARAALAAIGKYDNGATHATGITIAIPAATHGLGSGRGKLVSTVFEATGEVVHADTTIATNGDVTITFGLAQAANTIRVAIFG